MSTIAPAPEPVIARTARSSSPWRRAAVVGASLVVATGITVLLRPFIGSAIFVFYYGAVAVSALYAGFGAGMTVAIGGALLGNFIHFGGLEAADDLPTAVATVAFIAMSAVLGAIAESTRRARAEAEAHALQLQELAVELETQQEASQLLTEELEHANTELETAMKSAAASRDAALAGEDRLRLIDQASRVLASSLDYETTVAAVARLAVPGFADWAAVDILVDGDIKQLAIAHVDENKVKWARQLDAKYRPEADATTGVPQVIRTGQPQLVERVTDAMLVEAARDAEHLALLRALHIHSAIIVPLVARGSTIGALSLISCRETLTYDGTSLAVAHQLARRAAMAIDNARLYRAALAANEAKANFLATMSHELRTPLTAIIGYEELLAEGISGAVSDGQRQQLSRIKVSATHLLSIIDEILLYARVEAGREIVRIEPVVAKGVVDDALAFIAPSASERQLELRAEPIDPAMMLRTDAGKLRQMLLNLLENAVKFTTRGEVVVSVSDDANTMSFAVRDTGIGIDREDLEHIFDPFWQVEQTTTRKAGGSGLGLSVTQRLARLLGGEVTVRSEAYVGSTFTIALPKEPPRGLESRSA